MSLEELNMNIFQNEMMNIKSAKEFLKQSNYSTKSSELKNCYYIKSSLKDVAKTPRESQKTERKTSNLNHNENSTFLRLSGSKEDSFSKIGKLSSFFTHRERSQNKNNVLLTKNEESFVLNPKENSILKGSPQIFDVQGNYVSKLKNPEENKIIEDESFFTKDINPAENSKIINKLNKEIISLKEENALLKLENSRLKTQNDRSPIETFLETDTEKLKMEIKSLNSELLKYKSENKSLYACLLKTDSQCTESSVFKKFHEMEEHLKGSKEELKNTTENMKRNNQEIRKFKEYLKHLMENQEKSNKEENEKSKLMSVQIKRNQRKVVYLLRVAQDIQRIFEAAKNNQEVDIDEFMITKADFSMKHEPFSSEPNLSTEEYFLAMQQIEHSFSEMYDVLQSLSNLASDFYHQKYFNKFLLG